MSDGKLELAKSCLLTKLSAAKGQKQPEKTISGYVQKEIGLDEPGALTLLEELIRDQMIERITKGKTASIQMSPAAGEYLKTLPAYPPPPPPPDERLKCLALMELAAAGEKRLTAKDIAAGITPSLGLAKTMTAPALAYLASQNWVNEQPTGKSGKDEKLSYALADGGKEELARIPDAIKSLFPHLKPPTQEMKNFLLLEMLIAGDRGVLKTEIEKILAKPAGRVLGLVKQMAGPMLASLIREKCIDEEIAQRSGKASYLLTAHGKTELARGSQHPDVAFQLTGAALNELLRYAGGENAPAAQTQPVLQPIAQVAPLPAPIAPLTDDALIIEAKDLLRERHGHTGLVPIFELRQRITEKFGAQPASHAELDGRIKRLRRELRLRLVSISDRSRATPQQLSESVPGEEEMFFYVGELR